jgi:hypothetical protein
MTEYLLDHSAERWSRRWSDSGWVLLVRRDGAEREMGRVSAPAPATRRRVWVHRLDRNWAELAFYERFAILTREGQGAIGQEVVALAEEGRVAQHFHQLGFHEGNAWSEAATMLTGRELSRITGQTPAVREFVRLTVDGPSLEESRVRIAATKTTDDHAVTHPDRRGAIDAAERRLYELEAEGFGYRGTFAKAGTGDPLPHEKPPEPLLVIGKPTSPRDAVDRAVARLTDLHHRFPSGHAVVELLDANLAIVRNPRGWIEPRAGEPNAADLERLKSVDVSREFFGEMHAGRFGRWHARPTSEAPGPSSFDYFVHTYQTLTWVVRTGGAFYSGNVSGGGSCLIELRRDEYDCRELAEQNDGRIPGLAEGLVFHGGWHDGNSFIFDRRTTSSDGEWAIFPFGEGEPQLPLQPVEPEHIVPFGFWLFDRVEQLCDRIVPWLRTVQRP